MKDHFSHEDLLFADFGLLAVEVELNGADRFFSIGAGVLIVAESLDDTLLFSPIMGLPTSGCINGTTGGLAVGVF